MDTFGIQKTPLWLKAYCLTLKRLGYFGSWKNWGAIKAPP